MWSGSPVNLGLLKSRRGLPPEPRPAPRCQFQVAALPLGFVGSQLAMMTPKISLKDSFSAPDSFLYTRFDVYSVTPCVSSWAIMSKNREKLFNVPFDWSCPYHILLSYQTALCH